jgi:histidinol-phosphatase
VLVAEGAVDISAEAEVNLWDLAALQIIVTEAGGIFSDLSGTPAPDGGNVLCSNGQLHDEALSLLSAGQDTEHLSSSERAPN